MKMKPQYILLGLILLVGLFFRSYQIVERFEFAADGDLYSWIVKDILVNNHLRLIGQQTTVLGIFIGPAWYYLITPFIFLTKMDPIGVIIPATFIGMLTVFSYYFVFSKLFNIKVGLISAFAYAVLLSTVQLDRWVTPSTPTNLWAIWYFYTVINITRGNYRVLPVLGILIGLIWHIHIALIPSLLAVPAAIIASKKIPAKKHVFTFFIALFIISIPLLVFETRHQFQQTIALMNNFVTKNSEGATGLYKFHLVKDMITKNISALFFMPQSFKLTSNFFFILLILSSGIFLIKKKLLSSKELITLLCWFIGVVAFFSISSSPISEYYFANIDIIFLALASLSFYLLYNWSKVGKILVLSIFTLVFIKNSYFMVTQSYYHKGYVERKAVVDFIVDDAKKHNFPCIGITYITSPGENTGFRYFFYLRNQHLIHPSSDVPVYNIVIPDELSKNEVTQKFGHIGIIPPNRLLPKEVVERSCKAPNSNLIDPMWGYVD